MNGSIILLEERRRVLFGGSREDSFGRVKENPIILIM
nr:hypothetical protein BN993_00675 [Virgibacillus halodenitrificans]